MISALYRLEDVNGAIFIDGVDTKSIGLCALRSSICTVPSDPILFSGSLRKNLDPFNKHNDDVLWKILEEVKLKETVKALPAGIDTAMTQKGSNQLSVGQRQLVCLARAILRKKRILIVEQGQQCDASIQEVIRDFFKNCTVLTIAQRLENIVNSDRIMILDNGNLKVISTNFIACYSFLSNPKLQIFKRNLAIRKYCWKILRAPYPS